MAAIGAEFADLLENNGFDFYAGVPCSLLGPVIAALGERGYIAETREDAALGLAAGASMAGKRPVVLMQNSGFGVSLNALGSLQQSYGIPTLLVISWRGKDGRDAPEHLIMGRVMPELLQSYKIPWRELSETGMATDVAWARAEFDRTQKPVALIVPPGLFH
ncbi:MAG: thiamine pyrophosphate-binding protein [bacterium]